MRILASIREWFEDCPRWAIRLAMWGLVVAGLAVLVLVEPLGPVAWGLWIAWNSILLILASVRGLFNLRTIFRVRDVAARWAFWPALLLTLLLRSLVEPVLADVVQVTFPSGLMYFLWLLVVFPLLFLQLVMLNFLGAALGLFQGRRRANREEWARRGARAWWLAVTTVILAVALLSVVRAASLAKVGIVLSLPTLTLWYSVLIRRHDPRQFALAVGEALSRRLIFDWSRKGRALHLDLRGEALGLIAACVALTAEQLNLLAPLQGSSLLSLVQLRNTTLTWASQLNREALGRPGPHEQVVLLHMDAPELRLALTTRSEAGVQADAIRALASCGARRLVLPLPVLDEQVPLTELHEGVPRLRVEDVERTLRDVPELAAAMREAGNVVLAVPDQVPLRTAEPPPPGVFQRTFPEPLSLVVRRRDQVLTALQPAARETGFAALGSVRLAALPAVPATWLEAGRVPVPFLLFAALRGQPQGRDAPGRRSGFIEIAGVSVPLIDSDKMLVDFRAADRGRSFAHIPYSDVRGRQPHFARASLPRGGPHTNSGSWLPPEEFFAGKVVFLDSLAAGSRQTPVGTLGQIEIQAHATHTLLAESFLEPFSPSMLVLWTLLFGLAVGHLCVRRNPLQASWYVVLAVPVAIGVSVLALFTGKWLDPILPMTATAAAFLLVTQLTFSLERTAKEHHRSWLRRFVAPQILDELLEEPAAKLGLGGTRQRVCVLFADVRGFSQFAEQNTPEEVMRVVNLYMRALTDELHKHGGILDKYTGDGLMAIFRITGPPRERIGNAVTAALAMRDAAKGLSRQFAAAGRKPLQVGIGIHWGEAVVGLVGNPVHQVNYTALGHTVVIGARLQSLAAGGEVIISEAVHREVSGDFEVAERDPVPVKNVSALVRPFLVTGPAASRALPR